MTLEDSPFPRHEAVTPAAAAGRALAAHPGARVHASGRRDRRRGRLAAAGSARDDRARCPRRPDRRHRRPPLGWITAGGLLPGSARSPPFTPRRRRSSEQLSWIAPTASAADALRALADPAISHLARLPTAGAPAQGVVSEIDLVRLASGPDP